MFWARPVVARGADRAAWTPCPPDSSSSVGVPSVAGASPLAPTKSANGSDDDGNGIVDDVHGPTSSAPARHRPQTATRPTTDLVYGGHGVHTAGTIGAAGNNGVGITGVAQDVRIMPLRVCAATPSTTESRCPLRSIIAAINYAGEQGARVANMSLGGNSSRRRGQRVRRQPADPVRHLRRQRRRRQRQRRGVDHRAITTPAITRRRPRLSAGAGAIDNIICVAATDQADGLAGFSIGGPRPSTSGRREPRRSARTRIRPRSRTPSVAQTSRRNGPPPEPTAAFSAPTACRR